MGVFRAINGRKGGRKMKVRRNSKTKQKGLFDVVGGREAFDW